MIQKIPITPKYIKDNGLSVIDIESVNTPFQVKEKSIANIPPSQEGGSHSHPRIEAFIAFSPDLELVYLDQNGEKHSMKMFENNQHHLIIMPANIPHIVINHSKDSYATIFEFASDIQHDVENVEIL